MYYDDKKDDKLGKVRDPIVKITKWVRSRSLKEKAILAGIGALLLLLLLWLVIEDHDNLFVMAETVHFIGIALLVYKLVSKRNCGGLSLQSQFLTAIFLAVRLFCSFMMEYDIHTVLDFLTLAATAWVIYELMLPLKDTYQGDQDTIQWYYVVIPCTIAALLAHPGTHHPLVFRIMWAMCVYVEAVSVLPQLKMMQNAKIIDGTSFLMQAIGSGLWPAMVLLSEIVQTFILADFWAVPELINYKEDGSIPFSCDCETWGGDNRGPMRLLFKRQRTKCYYYLRSYVEGSGVIHLAAGIV